MTNPQVIRRMMNDEGQAVKQQIHNNAVHYQVIADSSPLQLEVNEAREMKKENIDIAA